MGSPGVQLTTVEAAGLSAVRRCVSVIANAVAGRTWQEWDGTRRLDASRLVLRPAAGMTRREWAWRVVVGPSPSTTWPTSTWSAGLTMRGVPRIRGRSESGPGPHRPGRPLGHHPAPRIPTVRDGGDDPAEAIIRVRGAIWPGVPPHLQGILAMARASMGMAGASEAYAAKYWAAGGTPVTQITTDQELSDPQAESIALRWQARRSLGPDFPAVMGKGAHADPFGADPTTQTAVEARRDIQTDVARHFGVPAHLAMVQTPAGSGMTYTNVELEGLSLDRYTLGGYVDPIQDAISDLLPGGWQGGRRMVIDMAALTRADQLTRHQAWAIALGGKTSPGWMTQPEVREAEGLPPGTGGPGARSLPRPR